MGSDKDAEPKIYIMLRILEAYTLDLTVITKHRGGSYEEDYDIDGTCYKVIFAGPQNDVGNRNHHGVALAVKAAHWAEWKGQWEPVSSRIVTARIHNDNETTLIVGAYAPTEVSEEHIKDQFYEQLEEVLSQVARDQKIILLGDFNANINPQDCCSNELVVGPYGCWKRPTNDNGLRLLDLCSQFGLVLTNTLNKMKTRDIFNHHN